MFKKIKKLFKKIRHPYFTNKNKRYKKFKVGEFTYGKPKVYSEPAYFSIGKFCSIADDVKIYVTGEHNYNWVSTYNFSEIFECKPCISKKGNVEIGNDVWIGDGAIILSGVKIGDGAIIGAKAVVVKDVEPYSIIVGNPAKLLKYRFTRIQIEKLLKIQWWNWEINKIESNLDLILNDNIDIFIETHYIR